MQKFETRMRHLNRVRPGREAQWGELVLSMYMVLGFVLSTTKINQYSIVLSYDNTIQVYIRHNTGVKEQSGT